MSMMQALLQEFDQEAATTRKCLERVPAGKGSYQPHAKSMTLGRLAGHIVEIPGWLGVTLKEAEFDVAPAGQAKPGALDLDAPAAILEQFDRNVADARAALQSTPDSALGEPWSLKSGGQVIFTMPKAAVLRGFVFSHLVHHRAQLALYLRLNDIPVPSIYGPSADDSGGM